MKLDHARTGWDDTQVKQLGMDRELTAIEINTETDIGIELEDDEEIMNIGMVLRGRCSGIRRLLHDMERILPKDVEIVKRYAHRDKLVIKIEE